MAIQYYGASLSENISESPEGYLLCSDVPIARTGWQTYLGREISPELESERLYQVWRDPEEVFSPATISSFEGKTVTDNHVGGTGLISTAVESMYHKGHAQNIHQGEGKDSDLLLADLIIKDPVLIDKVRTGVVRETSAGYSLEYEPMGENQYKQVKIVGNHIAIVQNGRAGSRVAIRDSVVVENNKEKRSSKMTLKELFTGWLQKQGADAKPEEISEALALVSSQDDQRAALDAALAPILQDIRAISDSIEEIKEKIKEKKDEKEAQDSSMKSLDAVEEELKEAKAKDEDEEKKECEASDEVVEAVPSPELSGNELPKNPVPGADSDAVIRATLKALKPVIARISNASERKGAADALAKELRALKNAPTAPPEGVYGRIMHGNVKATDEAVVIDWGKEIKNRFHKQSVVRR